MFEYLRNVRLKTISYGLIIFMVVAGGIVAYASFSTLREVGDAKLAWTDYNAGAAHKSRIMSDVRDAFGFGGLIHSFKNTVIRRDAEDLAKARAKAQEALQAIAEYSKLDLTPAETSAVNTIQQSIEAYARQIPELEQMIRSGATVEEIDRAVAVNDNSAIAAFDAIDSILRQDRTNAGAAVDELGRQVGDLHLRHARHGRRHGGVADRRLPVVRPQPPDPADLRAGGVRDAHRPRRPHPADERPRPRRGRRARGSSST